MTEHPHHLDRETAEQLLSGIPATPLPGAEALANLLSSAAGPAAVHELAGEDAAVMAFRASPAPARSRGVSVRRLLILKVSAIAALVTAGGLAFASGTGILPTPFKPAPPAPSPSAALTRSPALRPSPATELPSPDEVKHGLCNAYLGKDPAARERALKSTAFEKLVRSAGGPDKVEAYCQPSPQRSKKPADKPSSRDPKPSRRPN